MTNTGNEKVVNTTATINIKQVIRGYYEQLYAN